MKFTLTAIAFSLISSTALAQTEIQHNGLYADHYQGEGTTAVLVVHGTLAHKRMEIIETLSMLLNEDYDLPVVAPNLDLSSPNRPGMVDCNQIHRHTHTEASTEIGQWVSWMEQQGYDNIIVAAHSRGGAQLSAYLADSPSSAITNAVLIAPATFNAQYAADSYLEATGMSIESLLATAKSADANEVIDVPRFVYCDDAKATAASVIDYYEPKAEFDTPTNLQSIQIPTLVVMGSEDSVVAELPDRLASTELAANITIETIDGADHFFRDLYADDIASFIAERAGL